MTSRILLIIIAILCFTFACSAGNPVRHPNHVFLTTHTALNAAGGVTKEVYYDCYLKSITIGYSTAQTSTSIITIDSGEGSSYDHRINTTSLTGATSEIITFDDGEVLLKKQNSKGYNVPDVIEFQAVGADSATVGIIISTKKVKTDKR